MVIFSNFLNVGLETGISSVLLWIFFYQLTENKNGRRTRVILLAFCICRVSVVDWNKLFPSPSPLGRWNCKIFLTQRKSSRVRLSSSLVALPWMAWHRIHCNLSNLYKHYLQINFDYLFAPWPTIRVPFYGQDNAWIGGELEKPPQYIFSPYKSHCAGFWRRDASVRWRCWIYGSH